MQGVVIEGYHKGENVDVLAISESGEMYLCQTGQAKFWLPTAWVRIDECT